MVRLASYAAFAALMVIFFAIAAICNRQFGWNGRHVLLALLLGWVGLLLGFIYLQRRRLMRQAAEFLRGADDLTAQVVLAMDSEGDRKKVQQLMAKARADELPMFPCPACGYIVFEQQPGSHAICPVCDWQDDDVQLRHPTMAGGANAESLYNWQLRVARRIARNEQQRGGYTRDATWRPLRDDDCCDPHGLPTTGQAYFDAVDMEPARYYWRTGLA